MEQVEWEKLTPDEKKRQLFYKQKELLDTFLEHKAISREQYEKSLNDVKYRCGHRYIVVGTQNEKRKRYYYESDNLL